MPMDVAITRVLQNIIISEMPRVILVKGFIHRGFDHILDEFESCKCNYGQKVESDPVSQ